MCGKKADTIKRWGRSPEYHVFLFQEPVHDICQTNHDAAVISPSIPDKGTNYWHFPQGCWFPTWKCLSVQAQRNSMISGEIITTSLRPHHRWWSVREIIPKWPSFSLVNYSNSPRWSAPSDHRFRSWCVWIMALRVPWQHIRHHSIVMTIKPPVS